MKNLITSAFLILIFSFKINAQEKTTSNDVASIDFSFSKKNKAIEKSVDPKNIDFSFSKKKKTKNNEDIVAFNESQKKKAKEIAIKKLGVEKVVFGSAVVYKNKFLYWNVSKSLFNSYYIFKSDMNFSNVVYKKTRGINAKDYAIQDN